jgi:hypothetical protein
MVITTSAASRNFLGPRFGELSGDVDPGFGHCGERGGIDMRGWLGSAKPGDGPVSRQVGEPAERHL